MSKMINEGIKFGEKEVNDILSRSKDFNIGVEYEIRPWGEQKEDLDDYLESYGLSTHVDKVVGEHNDMTEVITHKMDLGTAIKHIKGMFKLIVDKDIEVPEMAGMHISISTNKYNLDDFNKVKFMVIMNSEFIHKIFPERKHVSDMQKDIRKAVENFSVEKFDARTISRIEDNIHDNLGNKYQTININQYGLRDGRVELRFFGGENYHTMFDDIKRQLLRSLFLLELGYTDLFQKEYYKELARYFDRSEEHKKYYSDSDMRDLKKAMIKKSPIEVTKVVLRPVIQQSSTEYIGNNSKEVFNTLPTYIKEKVIDIVSKDDKTAYIFARRVFKGVFSEGEDAIAENPRLGVQYAEFTSTRFKKGEDKILKDEKLAGEYMIMLHSEGILSTTEFGDMLVEMPQDALEGFFKQTTFPENQYSLSYSQLESLIVGYGDREIVETMIDVYTSTNSPEANLNAVIVANEYRKKYADDKPLLNREQLLSMIENDELFDVPAFNKSTLIKEALRSPYLTDNDVIKYLPKLKQAFIRDGIWNDAANYYKSMIHSNLQMVFRPRGEKVLKKIDELFKQEE